MSADEIIFLLSCLGVIGVYISIQRFVKVRGSRRQYRMNAGRMDSKTEDDSEVSTDHLVAKKKKSKPSMEKLT